MGNNKEPDIKSEDQDYFYSKKLKEHFFNPKNFVKGEKPGFEANGTGKVGSPACGDVMRMWVKINPESEMIEECGWKTFGCGSAIASTSVLSEMVKGISIKEALSIKPQEIKEKLGGMPEVKVHCSVLGDKALQAAINDYFKQTSQFERVAKKDEVIIDPQTQTSQKDIEKAIKEEGITTFEELQEKTKVGTGDPKAEKKAKEVFAHYRGK